MQWTEEVACLERVKKEADPREAKLRISLVPISVAQETILLWAETR